jgi:uncharacterized membrane protein YciS (DUF1049 family)
MSDWLIAGIYIAGFIVSWRVLYAGFVNHELKDSYRTDPDDRDRLEMAVVALVISALFWWGVLACAVVWAVGYWPWRWMTRPTRYERRIKRERDQCVELERLRKQAKKYDLPMGDS